MEYCWKDSVRQIEVDRGRARHAPQIDSELDRTELLQAVWENSLDSKSDNFFNFREPFINLKSKAWISAKVNRLNS
jgi:hypothetical protein